MRRAVVLLALLLPALPAAALPDLRHPRDVGAVRIYPDHERPARFYFGPGHLAIATDTDGRPELHLLQMRYVGTELYGNEGDRGSFSTLTLRIRMQGPSSEQLDFARRYVRRMAQRAEIELRPLPVTGFEAQLTWAPVDGPPAQPLPAGHFEADGSRAGRSSGEAFWTERVYTVGLSPRSSELLWTALHRGLLVMSLSYAFSTDGVVDDGRADLRVEGDAEAAEKLAEALAEKVEGPAVERRQVLSDVAAIRVDAARWPELFQRVDFEDAAPPGYAGLRVYCYDFKDGLRADLFYKKVEVEAVAVGGRAVPIAAKFLASQPDLYARTLRFPVAVHVDRPYRYRVTVASRDGRTETGPWVERASWGRILDVTTRPADAQLDPQPDGEGQER